MEIVADLDLDDRLETVEETLSNERRLLELAQSKEKVLTQYTKPKTIKELVSEVEKAKSVELAKQATWELEKGKEAKLQKQIAGCTLFAPIDGLVVYADAGHGPDGTLRPQIEERRHRPRAPGDPQCLRSYPHAGQCQCA